MCRMRAQIYDSRMARFRGPSVTVAVASKPTSEVQLSGGAGIGGCLRDRRSVWSGDMTSRHLLWSARSSRLFRSREYIGFYVRYPKLDRQAPHHASAPSRTARVEKCNTGFLVIGSNV